MTTTQTAVSPCSCCTVHHALTMLERAKVVTARHVAVDQGDLDRAGYLDQQLGNCPSSLRPVAEQRPRVKPIRRSAWRFGGAR